MKKLTLFFLALTMLVLTASSVQFAQMMNNNMMPDSISGHVYAAPGHDMPPTKIIANANISLYRFSQLGDTTLYSATSDSTGFFGIGNIKPGHYLLICNASGYSTFLRRDFEMGDENRSSFNILMHDTLSIVGSSINGRVQFDESEVPISNAIIEFISLNPLDTNVFATTDSLGRYSARVNNGQYYVSCTVSMSDSVSVFQIYFPHALTMAGAQIVNIGMGDMDRELNFDIPTHIGVKHNFTFTGNVTSFTNVPLDSAKINIFAAGQDRHDDRSFIVSTFTDASGNFTVTLDSIQQSFNVFIVAAHKRGYNVQFYNNQSAFFDANLLIAFNDTTFSNLNFTLTPLDTNSNYSISGTVTDTAGNGLKGVFVSAIDSATGKPNISISDSLGNYSVQGLTKGTYYLMFSAKGFRHEFFPHNDEWENAKSIVLDSSISGYNIVLNMNKNSNFGGEVSGDIHSDKGMNMAGVLVTVKDSAGNVIGSSITDQNGSYTIAGLTQGTYTIIASTSTYSSVVTTTTYNPAAGSTTISNITLTSSITAVKNQVVAAPSTFVLDNNYPNPFNPSTIIGFSLPYSSHVSLEIYNILGQKVAVLLNNTLAAGHYSYSFNANGLASGVYLYKLQTNNFVSVKKMILNK